MFDCGNLGVHASLDSPSLLVMHHALAGKCGADALLSNRQAQIAVRLARGKVNKEIAAELGLTEGTVKFYLTQLYARGWDRVRLATAGIALEMAGKC